MVDDRAEKVKDPAVLLIPCIAADPGVVAVEKKVAVRDLLSNEAAADRKLFLKIDDSISAADRFLSRCHFLKRVFPARREQQIQPEVSALQRNNLSFVAAVLKGQHINIGCQIQGRSVAKDREYFPVDVLRKSLYGKRSFLSGYFSNAIGHPQRVHSGAETGNELSSRRSVHVQIVLRKSKDHCFLSACKQFLSGAQ